MKLIKQFGYKKVKDALKTLIDKKKDLLTVGRAVYVREEIESMLLQNRRENNIFEKGDLIVFKNNWTANNSVLMVDGDSKNSIRLDTVLDLNNHFRHATQKEIAQGYRDE